MLSSMDSWLAWRTVRLGISTASPVSVLLWMAPFSLRPSPSRDKRGEKTISYCSQSVLQQSQGEAEKVFQKISLASGSQAVCCCHAAFRYSALLQQQLPVISGTNPVLQQARAQQKLKTYIPPYLLQPFVPINYASSAGARRHTSWLYVELPSLGPRQQ